MALSNTQKMLFLRCDQTPNGDLRLLGDFFCGFAILYNYSPLFVGRLLGCRRKEKEKMLCEEVEELAESSSENESLAESFESIPPLEFHSDSEASVASSLMVPPGFASEDDGEAL